MSILHQNHSRFVTVAGAVGGVQQPTWCGCLAVCRRQTRQWVVSVVTPDARGLLVLLGELGALGEGFRV